MHREEHMLGVGEPQVGPAAQAPAMHRRLGGAAVLRRRIASCCGLTLRPLAAALAAPPTFVFPFSFFLFTFFFSSLFFRFCRQGWIRTSPPRRFESTSTKPRTHTTMASEMVFKVALMACLVMYMASLSCGQVFDVTKYGAVGDGKTENSKAFLAAWKEACAYEGDPSFVIPAGTFLLGQVSLAGPCSNNVAIKVNIQGTIKAPPSLKAYTDNFWIEFRAVRGLEISGGGTIDGQGAVEAWSATKCPQLRTCKNMPTSLQLAGCTDATVSDLTLLDSKGFHMKVLRSAFVQVHHLNISAPGDSPNTDGIHISDTNHINVTNLHIGTGDDCISIGPGAIFVNIVDVVCGPGHGFSIGSLGKYQNEKDVSMVTVQNCTLKDTDNGVRIKTWPGSPPSVASHFTFEDIIMENVTNPIIIDQVYCPMHHCTSAPSQVQIRDVTFKHITGTTTDAVPVSFMCSRAVPCEEVHIEDIQLQRVTPNGNSTIGSVCTNVEGTALGVQIPQFCM